MQSRKLLICALGLVCSRGFGQSLFSLSSASAAPGGVVTLNISLNTAYPGSSAGLQWTLNAPSSEVASLTTTAGPAAAAAQKSLYCANQICLLAGLNSNAFSNGVIASVALTLSPTASGNLVIQLSDPVEALLDGEGGTITAASGIVNVTSVATPVSVGVMPTTASLQNTQSQQFSATVTGSTNSNVSWTMNPAIGTLSNSGLYNAPSTISSTQTVTVTATSAADPTKSASATITLAPTGSVTLNPPLVSLGPSQTQQFTAVVSNASNTGVTWSLIPPVGTISNGLYTAPATIASTQTVSVVATSIADATKSASGTITLVPTASLISIALSPSQSSLGPAQTQQFTATVANASTGVTWSLTPSIGTISNGFYTAPATITSTQTVSVVATSVADPTKLASASVILTATAPVSVSLTPTAVSVDPTQTTQFTPSVTNATNRAVTWSLTPPLGSITNGLYTPPANTTMLQSVTVTATSVADPTKSASSVAYLLPGISVSLSPSAVSLDAMQSHKFTANVTNTSNTAVTWRLSPAMGSISNGLYTAPRQILNSKSQTVTVTATSVADPTKSATAIVTLAPLELQDGQRPRRPR